MGGAADALVGAQEIQSAWCFEPGLGIVALGAGGFAEQNSAAGAELFGDLHQTGHRDPVLPAFVFLDLLETDVDKARQVMLRKPGGLAIGAYAGADLKIDGIWSLSHGLDLQMTSQLGERDREEAGGMPTRPRLRRQGRRFVTATITGDNAANAVARLRRPLKRCGSPTEVVSSSSIDQSEGAKLYVLRLILFCLFRQ